MTKMRVKNMVARRNSGKNKYMGALNNFGPIIKRKPNQGLLNFNSWQAQVFIEILGTMLVEQEFIELVFEPITETYAKFIKRANRNIWSLSHSKRLVVRVKYRRHAQRLAELLGAILTKRQFINLVLIPIVNTYIDIYTVFILGDTLYDDDRYSSNETLIGSDWNCNLGAFTSTPYKKMSLKAFSSNKRMSSDESITSTWCNSMSALLPSMY